MCCSRAVHTRCAMLVRENAKRLGPKRTYFPSLLVYTNNSSFLAFYRRSLGLVDDLAMFGCYEICNGLILSTSPPITHHLKEQMRMDVHNNDNLVIVMLHIILILIKPILLLYNINNIKETNFSTNKLSLKKVNKVFIWYHKY